MLGDQDSQFQWFDFETRMRKLIKDVMITYDKQLKDDEKRLILIEKEMSNNEIRLKEIEFLLFKSEDKQDRFDEIQKILSQMESDRRKDIVLLNQEQQDFKKLISDKVFIYDTKLRQIDQFEQMLQKAIVDYEKIDTMIKNHKQQFMQELSTNLEQQNEIIKQKSEEVSQVTAKLVKIEPKLVYFSQEIMKLEQVDMKQTEILDKMKIQIQELKDNKLDSQGHLEFRELLEEKLRSLTENYSIQIDRMLNNENYVEKYAPIYTQRMINDTLEQILKKKQKKKLIKYNEVKMPILLQAIFDDMGLPNLIQVQRKFHTLIMNGLISDQERFLRNAMQDEKERTKVKWQIQNKMPPIQQLQAVSDYTPIQNGAQQIKNQQQSSFRRTQLQQNSSNLRQKSETNNSLHTPPKNVTQNNVNSFVPIKRDSNVTTILPNGRDMLEQPLRSDYKGPFKINDPDVINMYEKKKVQTDDERKAELLTELYKHEEDSNTDKDENKQSLNHDMLQNVEDDDDDDHDDSFDFEQQLKKDVSNMVVEKLETFERRLKYLIVEHEGKCKDEFKMYESHIKDQVKKMTAYVSEVHASHIAEINNFKKEKSEQVLVNQMVVKKVQSIEQWKAQQFSLQVQQDAFNFRIQGHCLENFVSIFKAIEMADDQFVMHIDNQHEEVVLKSTVKELPSAKKNALNAQNLNEKSISQTSNHNIGTNVNQNDFLQQNQTSQNLINSVHVKKLITDKNQKQYNESTLQAIQHVMQKKRNYSINIINHNGDSNRILRNQLFNEYMKIEQLVEDAIHNINLIKEGEHVKIIKKNIFQISKTRQPSPNYSDEELTINKAMDQKLNGSILVQGTGPGVLGPINYMKLQKQSVQNIKSHLNQTMTKTDLGHVFSFKRQSQNTSKIQRKHGKNPSRIEESESNHHFRTLSGMTPTNLSFAKKTHTHNFTHINLEDSSLQMPTINQAYNPNQSIMIQDAFDKDKNLNSSIKIDKNQMLPQISLTGKKLNEIK